MKHDRSLADLGLAPENEGEEAIRRWDELKGTRAHYEGDWESLARLIRPQRGGFASADPARVRDEKPLSSAPIIAQSNFSAGLYGTLTNPANRWLTIRSTNEDLNGFQPMKLWCDAVATRILASFRPSVSPFYSAAVQLFGDIATFGNAAQYDEVRLEERKILDVTLSLAEVVFDIDAWGRVNEAVRKFKLKPRAAVIMFEGQVPAKVRELAEKGSQEEHWYYHHVKANADYRRGRLGPAGKRWLSIYVCEIEKMVVRRAGYEEMPFHAPRWEVESGQVYGTGPGFIALASARVSHRMQEANLRAGQKAADPTLLAADRRVWKLNGVVRPGHTVYGGVDMQGRPTIRPLDNFSSTGLSLEMQQELKEEIRDAFHYSLMNLAGRTGMTATEVIEIQEEKMRLMAPHMGRIQEEYLAPKIARRFQILYRAGQLPPPPQGIPEGAGLEVVYTSAAAMAQKSAEGAAVVRILQDIVPLASIDPMAASRLGKRISVDDVLEVLQEARGAPSRVLRSREEADALQQAEAEAAQQQQLLEQGPGAMRDLAQAGAAMQHGGGGP